MSTSAEPTSGSAVTERELTAILEDYYFYCAVAPAGWESALFIEQGQLECPACGVQGRMRLLSSCFLLCTCRERRQVQLHFPILADNERIINHHVLIV